MTIHRTSATRLPRRILALSIASLCAGVTALCAGTPALAAQTSEPALVPTVTATLHTITMPNLQAVAFASPDIGWLAADNMILATSDGGAHFHVQYRGPLQCSHIEALSPKLAIAWGSTQILMTTDGGSSWHVVKAPPGPSIARSIYLDSVQFISSQTGFAVVGNLYQLPAAHQVVYVTHNGGVSWQALTHTPADTMAIGFANAQDGFLVSAGAAGGFYHTANAGATWTRSKGTLTDWYPQGATLFVTSPDNAYAQILGQAGMSQSSSSLFHTVNGRTWTPVLGVPTAGGGPAPGIGGYVYRGTVSANAKTARLQKAVPIGPGYDVGPVAVVAPNILRVAGGMEATGDGAVQIAASNDGGRSWTKYPTVQGAAGMPVFSNMSFVSAQDGWLLMTQNSRQVLLRTTDGGAHWRQIYPAPTPWPVQSVTLVNARLGFGLGIVGNVDAVLKTTNGGRTWQPLAELPVNGRQEAYVGPDFGPGLSFANAQDGWAIGGDGSVYATHDAGRTWSRLPVPAGTGSATALYLLSPTKGIVWTDQGLFVTTDGGVTRTSLSTTAPNPLLNAFVRLHSGLAASDGSLLGPNAAPTIVGVHGPWMWLNGAADYMGFIFSKNSGHTFTAYQFSDNANISVANLGFTSDMNGFIWTLGGRLFTTQDGGHTWSQID